MCRSVQKWECASEIRFYGFERVQGGRSLLERHTNTHKSGPSTARFQRQLPIAVGVKVAQAAVRAVSLDIRPLPSSDGCVGMRHFAKTVF